MGFPGLKELSFSGNCKAPEHPKIKGGFSGLADATSPQ